MNYPKNLMNYRIKSNEVFREKTRELHELPRKYREKILLIRDDVGNTVMNQCILPHKRCQLAYFYNKFSIKFS